MGGGGSRGKEGINGDGRRLDLVRVVNPQYNVQMMYYIIIYLKPM